MLCEGPISVVHQKCNRWRQFGEKASYQQELGQVHKAAARLKRDLVECQQARSTPSDQLATLKEHVRGLEELVNRETKAHQGTVQTLQAELRSGQDSYKKFRSAQNLTRLPLYSRVYCFPVRRDVSMV